MPVAPGDGKGDNERCGGGEQNAAGADGHRGVLLLQVFHLAGLEATIYDSTGQNLLVGPLPMIALRERDIQVFRDESSVPIAAGDFSGIIPLTLDIPNAAQEAVRFLRRGITMPYDLLAVDDDEAEWMTRLVRTLRHQPVGAR